MRLDVVTIVKNGYPFLLHHLSVLSALTDIEWHWHIVEGTADNVLDTKWCSKPTPGLSTDGTSEFLDSLRNHPRVHVHKKPLWAGKVEMFNTALKLMTAPSLLLQIDADEFWESQQLRRMLGVFESRPEIQRAYFRCNFFVGPNLVTSGTYGDGPTEWLRAWRYTQGMRFDTHEPPVLAGNKGLAIGKDETAQLGLVFNHLSYVLESQIEAKSIYYKYAHGTCGWKSMQANRQWPERLSKWFWWVTDLTQVKPLYR